jgi:hypothetical protein
MKKLKKIGNFYYLYEENGKKAVAGYNFRKGKFWGATNNYDTLKRLIRERRKK